jgi:undecaprenyl-diphosphatase
MSHAAPAPAAARRAPASPASRRPVAIPLVVAAIGVVVVVAGGIALRRSAFDLPVDQWLNQGHAGAGAAIGDLVYTALGPLPAIVVTAVIAVAIAAIRRDLFVASTFAVAVAATWLSSAAVKIITGRPRPEAALLLHPPAPQGDASYPSGHTVFVTALVVTAVMVTGSVALRRVWAIAGILAVLGVALAVVSDGLHFPTDVLASVVWAACIAPAVSIVWARFVAPRVPLLRPRGRRVAGAA